ncbi:MAG: glutathione S-transferase family protein [Oligoflexia bacterium]|nr:glutathione S-transferase family protein [Oligoflexia bacterium]
MWTNPQGEFVRPESVFRRRLPAAEAGRYHLYVSLACPWAHRTLIVRKLRKLDEVISVSVVDPVWNEAGWCFSDYPGATRDPVNHAPDLISIYRLAEPGFAGEETVPVLWDKREGRLVNNESLEIIKMLDQDFAGLGDPSIELYPEPLRPEIDRVIAALYRSVNNGVYRAGFATTQAAHEKAATELFAALDHWEARLAGQRYLCGNRLTLADVCLFTTLVRFDAVYYSHFKCNVRRIAEYPQLGHYLRDLYQTRGFGETVNLDHIKRHYYVCHREVNPTGIVPIGPTLDFTLPHDRARFTP